MNRVNSPLPKRENFHVVFKFNEVVILNRIDQQANDRPFITVNNDKLNLVDSRQVQLPRLKRPKSRMQFLNERLNGVLECIFVLHGEGQAEIKLRVNLHDEFTFRSGRSFAAERL